MPSAPRQNKRGLFRIAMCLLALALAQSSCGNSPLLVLDLTYVGGETSLRVKTQISGGTISDIVIPGPPGRLALSLPSDASGLVQIDLFGSDATACWLSEVHLTVDVPGGLSRGVEVPAVLSLSSTKTCPLTVSVSGNGGGSVTSSPAGINCQANNTGTCTAYFAVGSMPQLLTSPATGAYVGFSPPCISSLNSCSFLFDGPSAIQVMFQPLTCSPNGWCQISPAVSRSSLYAVTGFQGTEALAVGDAGTVLRCSGAACIELTSNTTQKLTAVWRSDAGNVYAVGDGGTILRCATGANNCTALTSNTTQNLAAVWGSDASNVYAVGNGGTIVRCAAGSNSCTALTSNTTQQLSAVWGSDASNVYAVSWTGNIVRCAGGSNSCTALTSNTTMELRAVWGSDANNVYAVGFPGVIVRCAAGSNSCTVLTSNTTQQLLAVWGSDASNVYVVGNAGGIVRCAAGSNSCTALTSNTTRYLAAVWGSDAGNVYAVGWSQTIQHCAAGSASCMPQASNTTPDLNAVWGKDANHIYAVGVNGTVLYKGL